MLTISFRRKDVKKMHIRDVSAYEIIEKAWEGLPSEGTGGHVMVLVNIKDGNVRAVYEDTNEVVPVSEYEESIFILKAGSKSEIISDWITDEDIIDWLDIREGRTRYGLPETELHSCTLDTLHERFENKIQCRISEILKKYPHLVK